jgi:hypothetical protein
LVPPGIPELGEPVKEDYGTAGSCLGDVHVDPVGLNGPVGDLRLLQGLHLFVRHVISPFTERFAIL